MVINNFLITKDGIVYRYMIPHCFIDLKKIKSEVVLKNVYLIGLTSKPDYLYKHCVEGDLASILNNCLFTPLNIPKIEVIMIPILNIQGVFQTHENVELTDYLFNDYIRSE